MNKREKTRLEALLGKAHTLAFNVPMSDKHKEEALRLEKLLDEALNAVASITL